MIEFANITLKSALPLPLYLAEHPFLRFRVIADGVICGETTSGNTDLATGIWETNSSLWAHTVKHSLTLAITDSSTSREDQLASVTLSAADLLERVKARPGATQEFNIADPRSSTRFLMTCLVKVSGSPIVGNSPSQVSAEWDDSIAPQGGYAQLYSQLKQSKSLSRKDLEDFYTKAICLPDQDEKARLLNLLGSIYHALYWKTSGLAYLDKAISMHEEAMQCTESFYPQLAEHVHDLALALTRKFQLGGALVDIEQAISHYRTALALTDDRDAERPGRLGNLGVALQHRFERLGSLADLEDAISNMRKVIKLMPDGHADKAGWLSNLGNELQLRFQRLGTPADLEDAISNQRKAVELTPDGHPNKTHRFNNLGNALLSRFERLGGLTDLENSIASRRKAVELTPDGHIDKAGWLSNLGNALQYRFKRLGSLTDLENAITNQRKAVELTPDDHVDKAGWLSNLGVALQYHFERLGSLKDLEDAISNMRKAVELTPYGHPEKAGRLNNLGNALQSRFERLGSATDLENAISNQRKAVEPTPDGHPDKASWLNNLGNTLQYRFERLGSLVDLENAIASQRKAVELTPDGHVDKANYLSNLGNALQSRFERLGILADLEDAISNKRKAVELTPDGHPEKAGRLNNLGNAVQSRFDRLGSLEDLENAISNQRKAVELTPDGHPNKTRRFNNLGTALQSRFEHLGGLTDLENAIASKRKAVELTPDGHVDKPGWLSNLGNSLQYRSERLGSLTDLEDAISNKRKAVKLTPDGHPEKAGWLNNLGISLQYRFETLGSLTDLEDAVSSHRKTVELAPDGHPDTAGWLNSLGNALQSRFERLGRPADLEDAISNQRKAVELTPDGHPGKARWLNNLGIALKSRLERFGSLSDLEGAIYALSTAANSTSGPAMVRFKAARVWASVAEKHSISPLDAFGCAINLLPQIAWLGLAVTDQHALLADVGDIVRDAVAAAINHEEYETAVTWAEQGRSIVWQNLLGLRSPVDLLRQTHPDVADRLLTIAHKLEGSGSRVEMPTASAGDVSRSHSKWAIDWDNLIDEIRSIPNFEGFLRAKNFSQLAPAAHEGPVVILNVNESQCDALVLVADDSDEMHVSAVNIPLRNFSYEKSKIMFQGLKNLLSSAGLRERNDRKTGRHQSRVDDEAKFQMILGTLWRDVVKPVIEGLAFQTNSERPPRIWWCTTGLLAFLPIHAAGLYDTQEIGEKVSDYVVSSYTPTLSAILDLSGPVVQGKFQVLTVAQPSAPGAQLIPKTEDEVRIIHSLITGASVLNLTKEEATVERVREGMMESNWIHLACHGQQNPRDPMESGFLLHDKILKLSEIVKMSLPKADFAFLSACQTAMGDERVAEESVHLAAGMFLSGCRGVVATTWSIRDEDGPTIAEGVYSRIFKDGRPDRKEAAYALYEAVKRLRESGAQCTSWVPFIHIGR